MKKILIILTLFSFTLFAQEQNKELDLEEAIYEYFDNINNANYKKGYEFYSPNLRLLLPYEYVKKQWKDKLLKGKILGAKVYKKPSKRTVQVYIRAAYISTDYSVNCEEARFTFVWLKDKWYLDYIDDSKKCSNNKFKSQISNTTLEIEAPPYYEKGKGFTVKVTLLNETNKKIKPSIFTEIRNHKNLDISYDYSSFNAIRRYSIGSKLWHKKLRREHPIQNEVIETIKTKAENSKKESFFFTITNKNSENKDISLNIRALITDTNKNSYNPKYGIRDQQGYYTIPITIPIVSLQ